MRRCYLLKVKLLGSCTKELFIGGINIRNISTKAWSNLNEEIIRFRNFYLIARFLSLVLNFICYCFRVSSYDPGNRAGSVTGMNFVVCSYGKFQPDYRDEIQETKPKWCNINIIALYYSIII